MAPWFLPSGQRAAGSRTGQRHWFWGALDGGPEAAGPVGVLGTPWDLLHQDTAWLIPQRRGDGVQVWAKPTERLAGDGPVSPPPC